MNFYVANKQNLKSALKAVYRQKEIGGPQTEKTIINAGEAVWSQIIAPNFNPRKGLPFMWYENSGFDVLANTLEEMRIKNRDIVNNPKNRAIYEADTDYPYSPMNYILEKHMGNALLIAGTLAPAKEKFEHSHINNYFYSLFAIGLKESNLFWAIPLITPPSRRDTLDQFIIESIDALKSRVISTYLYKTINTTEMNIEVFDHLAPESNIAKQKIQEMSDLMADNNPITNPIELYEADLSTIAKPGLVAEVVPALRRQLTKIKETLPVYSKTFSGWEKITYTH